MSAMKMTMIGLQTALSRDNLSLFDNLNLPSDIDKDTVVDNIMLEGADFEVLYADPYFMRAAIGTWSNKHYRTFEKWIAALNLEYNPLENYDRQEDWTDALDSDTTNQNNTAAFDTTNITDTISDSTIITDNASDNRTVNNTVNDTSNVNVDTITTGTEDDTGSTENTVSAFDSNTYQPSDKSNVTNNTTSSTDSESTTTSTQQRTDNTTDNNTHTDRNENTFSHSGSNQNLYTHSGTNNDVGTRDDTSIHSGRIHGNIGVTTSQQMLQSELDIARFNIVQQITDLFLTEFCIMIYT